MGLEYVDLFYSHRFDPDTPLEETMDALATAIRQGKALYAGISNYSPEDTKRACDILKGRGVHCLIHQPRYNMFDRKIENGLFDVLIEEGVGCIAFSSLAQGLLTDSYFNGIPADSRAGGESVFLDGQKVAKTVEAAKKLGAVAKRRGQSLAQMALAWNLRNPVMTSLIIGASSLKQIEDNLAAKDNMAFSPEELKEIDGIIAGINV
jgi:L-glyceraldehyde 3-phosphate reductase